MSATDWSIDERIERRHQAARRRIGDRNLAVLRRRREWRRDMARAALAVALIVVGVLLIEMGRKAVTLVALAAERPAAAAAAPPAASIPAPLPSHADGPSFGQAPGRPLDGRGVGTQAAVRAAG